MLLKMMTLALLNTYKETKQQLQGLKMEVNRVPLEKTV